MASTPRIAGFSLLGYNGLVALYHISVALLDWMGRGEYVFARSSDPGWIGKVLAYLLNPQPWVILPTIAIGLFLIWWTGKERSAPKVADIALWPLRKLVSASMQSELRPLKSQLEALGKQLNDRLDELIPIIRLGQASYLAAISARKLAHCKRCLERWKAPTDDQLFKRQATSEPRDDSERIHRAEQIARAIENVNDNGMDVRGMMAAEELTEGLDAQLQRLSETIRFDPKYRDVSSDMDYWWPSGEWKMKWHMALERHNAIKKHLDARKRALEDKSIPEEQLRGLG